VRKTYKVLAEGKVLSQWLSERSEENIQGSCRRQGSYIPLFYINENLNQEKILRKTKKLG